MTIAYPTTRNTRVCVTRQMVNGRGHYFNPGTTYNARILNDGSASITNGSLDDMYDVASWIEAAAADFVEIPAIDARVRLWGDYAAKHGTVIAHHHDGAVDVSWDHGAVPVTLDPSLLLIVEPDRADESVDYTEGDETRPATPAIHVDGRRWGDPVVDDTCERLIRDIATPEELDGHQCPSTYCNTHDCGCCIQCRAVAIIAAMAH